MTEQESALRVWLERAVCWRFASTLFRTPTADGLHERHVLLPILPDQARDEATPLLDVDLDTWEREFHRVLGPGGIPSCESSYDRAALAGRGPLLAAIGGFYQAFGYAPDTHEREVPDNIAVELDFLAYLAFKGAFAANGGSPAELDVTTHAYEAFRRDHLNFWIAAFLDALAATDSDFYRAATTWLQHTCLRLQAGDV
jgi:TorA maturation chaperone TorD